MKVYIVISDVVYDCDGTPEVDMVCATKEDAQNRMKDLFDFFKDEGWFDAADKETTTYTETQMCAWRDGEYSCYHCNIFIAEKEVQSYE